MSFNRRDIIQMLRNENELLKTENQQLGIKLVRLQQAFRALNDIQEVNHQLTDSTDITSLFHQLLELVLHTCNCENGSLILLDEKKQELEFVEVIGVSREALINHRINMNTGIVGKSIKTMQARLIEDVHTSAEWSSAIDDYLSFHTASLMCAPLSMQNRVIGAIELVNHTGDSIFDENDLNVLRVATSYVGSALEKAEKIMLSKEALK